MKFPIKFHAKIQKRKDGRYYLYVPKRYIEGVEELSKVVKEGRKVEVILNIEIPSK